MKKQEIAKLIAKTAASIISCWSHLYKQVENGQRNSVTMKDVALTVLEDQVPFSSAFLRGTKEKTSSCFLS